MQLATVEPERGDAKHPRVLGLCVPTNKPVGKYPRINAMCVETLGRLILEFLKPHLITHLERFKALLGFYSAKFCKLFVEPFLTLFQRAEITIELLCCTRLLSEGGVCSFVLFSSCLYILYDEA